MGNHYLMKHMVGGRQHGLPPLEEGPPPTGAFLRAVSPGIGNGACRGLDSLGPRGPKGERNALDNKG